MFKNSLIEIIIYNNNNNNNNNINIIIIIIIIIIISTESSIRFRSLLSLFRRKLLYRQRTSKFRDAFSQTLFGLPKHAIGQDSDTIVATVF